MKTKIDGRDYHHHRACETLEARRLFAASVVPIPPQRFGASLSPPMSHFNSDPSCGEPAGHGDSPIDLPPLD